MRVLEVWLGRVYTFLLRAYPADFRRRFGAEMEQLFRDRVRAALAARGASAMPGLLLAAAADWMRSVVRERFAPASNAASLESAPSLAPPGVPVFHLVGSEVPRASALVHGGFLTLFAFAAVTFLIGIGGSGRRFLVGSHHPSRSHLAPVRSEAEPARLDAEVQATPYPDEVPVSPYFRLILVLAALDADRDNILSADEIAHAPQSLRKPDRDGDGRLSPEECGFVYPPGLDPESLPRARALFMRAHPVLAALDVDRDGVISSKEMKAAAASLRGLDSDGDGRLTLPELLPDPRYGAALRILALLDLDGDGSISIVERSMPKAAPFRSLLDRADRNRDGLVTVEELVQAGP